MTTVFVVAIKWGYAATNAQGWCGNGTWDLSCGTKNHDCSIGPCLVGGLAHLQMHRTAQGIEPGTSRTRSEIHTTKQSRQVWNENSRIRSWCLPLNACAHQQMQRAALGIEPKARLIPPDHAASCETISHDCCLGGCHPKLAHT